MESEEIDKLANAEKELAIESLHKLFKVPEGFGDERIRFVVEKILNAAMLRIASTQKEAMKHRTFGDTN